MTMNEIPVFWRPGATDDHWLIAVASQNRKEVTGHAGRCRKFWIYRIEHGQVADKSLLELPKEQSLHESAHLGAHPLDAVRVLITGGMGAGLVRRLARMGIEGVATTELDPDRAVLAYLTGTLPTVDAHTHAHHDSETHRPHTHAHRHTRAGCACGD